MRLIILALLFVPPRVAPPAEVQCLYAAMSCEINDSPLSEVDWMMNSVNGIGAKPDYAAMSCETSEKG
eukprot:7703716-Karenia_brevis.AAC.1